MSERVETVEIVGEDGGKLIINKSDFDKEKHKEFKEVKKGSKDWLKSELDNAGIEYDSASTKADLEEIFAGLEAK